MVKFILIKFIEEMNGEVLVMEKSLWFLASSDSKLQGNRIEKSQVSADVAVMCLDQTSRSFGSYQKG